MAGRPGRSLKAGPFSGHFQKWNAPPYLRRNVGLMVWNVARSGCSGLPFLWRGSFYIPVLFWEGSRADSRNKIKSYVPVNFEPAIRIVQYFLSVRPGQENGGNLPAGAV